jgi:predicted glycoside hydrolase/deacetylase ChbG (UPF0249 family)
MPAAGRSRRLTVCVDDFGLHPGINAAALALLEQERIGAVSCMVGAPAWQQGAAALRGVAARSLDVGLHLDLTQFTLKPACRKPLAEWIARSSIRLLDRDLLRTEISGQLDRFEAGIGRAPAHVDGHQHVHQFPVVRDLLLALLANRYADRLPWLRSTRVPARGPLPRLKAQVIQALGEKGLRRLCQACGFRQNKHLLGVYGFDGGADRYLALLAAWLGRASDGDVLMCHPSTDAGAQSLPAARRWEFEVLGGAGFGELLRQGDLSVGPLRPEEGEPDHEAFDRNRRPGALPAVGRGAGARPGEGDARPGG